MQNTARDSQPVSWTDIEQAIRTNSYRKRCVEPIVAGDGDMAESDTNPVPWMPKGWTYAPSLFKATPLSIVLMATDPLYEISAVNTRREMERDVAKELVSEFDMLYGKYNGRGRGWVKTTTTAELGQWAAGATDVPFEWSAILEKRKILSALLDIVCIKFGIRIAVWWSEHKKIGLWPIQETESESWSSAPILNVEVLTSGEAHVLQNPDTDIRVRPLVWTGLFKTIGEWQWTRPPTCPSISGKTLTELRADYEGIAGEAAAAALSKKIDKETLATLHYRYECMELRLAPKEDTFF